jgi:hypothetical protein
MASRRSAVIIALGLMIVAAGAVGYVLWRPATATPIVGIVRATEVRVAPEVGGQLAAINVQKGARVRAGEVVAELSALELTAAVAQARAALAAAAANRDHVYAGVRAEEIAGLAAEIAKAKSRLAYAELQLGRTATLARQDVASQQSLDQAQNDAASARADVAEAEANHAAAQAGPTREQRAIADAEVNAAASALAVLERQLDKTILRAPADGVRSPSQRFWSRRPSSYPCCRPMPRPRTRLSISPMSAQYCWPSVCLSSASASSGCGHGDDRRVDNEIARLSTSASSRVVAVAAACVRMKKTILVAIDLGAAGTLAQNKHQWA